MGRSQTFWIWAKDLSFIWGSHAKFLQENPSDPLHCNIIAFSFSPRLSVRGPFVARGSLGNMGSIYATIMTPCSHSTRKVKGIQVGLIKILKNPPKIFLANSLFLPFFALAENLKFGEKRHNFTIWNITNVRNNQGMFQCMEVWPSQILVLSIKHSPKFWYQMT